MLKKIHFCIATLLLLGGCTSSPGTQALVDAFNFNKKSDFSTVRLDPGYVYLRVNVMGRDSFLARGHVEDLPNGRVEVWYGGRGEVLKTRNGRLLAILGTEIEWLSVTTENEPDWSRLGAEVRCYKRIRDEAPSYRYGIRETVCLTPSTPPRTHQLARWDPAQLIWYDEVVTDGHAASPSSRYALAVGADGLREAVYSELCLKPKLCMSWQRWDISVKAGQ